MKSLSGIAFSTLATFSIALAQVITFAQGVFLLAYAVYSLFEYTDKGFLAFLGGTTSLGIFFGLCRVQSIEKPEESRVDVGDFAELQDYSVPRK